MFVKVEREGIIYSDGGTQFVPRVSDIVTTFGDHSKDYEPFAFPVDARPTYTTLRVGDFATRKGDQLSRYLANPTEKVWFLTHDMDAALFPHRSPFAARLSRWQVGCLPLICETYHCSQVEAEGLVREGIDHTPPEQAFASVSYFLAHLDGNVHADRHGAGSPFWQFSSEAFAWMMNLRDVRDIPHLQSLGFEFEKVEKMDEVAHANWATRVGLFFAIEAGNRLVENVNIASKVALDSAQPVTIDVGPNPGAGPSQFFIKFENKRLSPLVAGLHITLPTGGVVFLRDAVLDPQGNLSRIVNHQRVRVSNRYLARRIVERMASDQLALSEARHCGTFEEEQSSSFLDSYREFINEPQGE